MSYVNVSRCLTRDAVLWHSNKIKYSVHLIPREVRRVKISVAPIQARVPCSLWLKWDAPCGSSPSFQAPSIILCIWVILGTAFSGGDGELQVSGNNWIMNMQVILCQIFCLYWNFMLCISSLNKWKEKRGSLSGLKNMLYLTLTPIVMKCSERLVLSNINLPEQQGTNMPTGQTTPLTGWHHNSPPHPKYPNTSKPKRWSQTTEELKAEYTFSSTYMRGDGGPEAPEIQCIQRVMDH